MKTSSSYSGNIDHHDIEWVSLLELDSLDEAASWFMEILKVVNEELAWKWFKLFKIKTLITLENRPFVTVVCQRCDFGTKGLPVSRVIQWIDLKDVLWDAGERGMKLLTIFNFKWFFNLERKWNKLRWCLRLFCLLEVISYHFTFDHLIYLR